MSTPTTITDSPNTSTPTLTAPNITAPDIPVEPKRPAKSRKSGRGVSVGFVLAAAVLTIVTAWALFPGLFTSADPIDGDATETFLAPSTQYWFGTDHLGRDLYARMVYGTTQTFLTAGIAVLLGLVIGVAFGIAAATWGRAADTVFMRLVDVLLSVPPFLIALLIVTMSGPGAMSLGIGVGIAAIASFARVTRAEILRVRNLDYVEAAFMNGGTYFSVLRKHVLPNAIGPVLALVTTELGVAMLLISSLGFLGFGAPPPQPEWGLIISEGSQYMASSWWMTTLPGIVIVITVVSLGVVSRRLLSWLRV